MLQNAHFDASRSADLESVETGQKGQLRQREERVGKEGRDSFAAPTVDC